MPHTDPRAFVQSLDIPEVAVTKENTIGGFESAETAKEEAFVNNKSVVSFVSAVSAQNRQDILNSSLLAQKVADKKYPKHEDMMQWYETYIDTLKEIGWVLEAKESAKFSTSDTIFEMEKVVVDILKALVGQNYISVITSTLDAMKSLSKEDKKIKVFESASHSLHKGNFQIGLVTEENETVSMHIGAFMLNTTDEIRQVLFFKGGKDESELNYHAIRCTLNLDLYARVREAIVEKLGGLIETSIGKFEI